MSVSRTELHPLDIPVCPHCGNAIEEWDEAEIACLAGSKYLAHAECLKEVPE